MSLMYCHQCGNHIDTDYDAEHFDDEVNGCEIMCELGLNNKITKAHNITARLRAGMTMISRKGKLGWTGTVKQWQEVEEQERMAELLRNQSEMMGIWK